MKETLPICRDFKGHTEGHSRKILEEKPSSHSKVLLNGSFVVKQKKTAVTENSITWP